MSQSPGPTAAPSSTDHPGSAWDWLGRLDLRRSDDRWLGGVAAGLADRLGVDPVLVRVALVVVGLLGGAGVVLYAVAWLLLPDRAGRIEARAVVAGEVSAAAVVALGLLALAVVVPGPWTWWSTGPVVTGGDVAVLLVVAAALATAVVLAPRLGRGAAGRAAPGGPGAAADGGGDRPAPRRSCGSAPRRRAVGTAAGAAVLGGALVVGAATWLLLSRATAAALLGTTAPQVSDLTAAALAVCAGTAVVALALLVAGLAGRRSGGGLGFWATSGAVAAVVVASVPAHAATSASGDARWRPTTVAAAERGYASLAGEASLDLRALPAPTRGSGVVEVPLRHGFGQAVVRVPDGVDVRVRGRLLAGQLTTSGGGWTRSGRTSGLLPDGTARTGDGPARVVVDATAFFGEIRVVRGAA